MLAIKLQKCIFVCKNNIKVNEITADSHDR